MTTFNPKDWYWLIGGDNTQAYSSKVGLFVTLGDAAYVAFLAADNFPTHIATKGELGAVLARERVTPPPTDPEMLAAYQDALADEIVKAANANLILYTLNTARVAAGETPIPQNQFAQFIKDNNLT